MYTESNRKTKEGYPTKTKKQNRNIIIVKQSQPIYPNAADRNYRATRALNVVTALVSGMGFVSAMVFLVTMV